MIKEFKLYLTSGETQVVLAFRREQAFAAARAQVIGYSCRVDFD